MNVASKLSAAAAWRVDTQESLAVLVCTNDLREYPTNEKVAAGTNRQSTGAYGHRSAALSVSQPQGADAMAKYRVIVEAVRWTDWADPPLAVGRCVDIPGAGYVDARICHLGEWIVQAPGGERYPVAPDVFELNYEPVAD